MSLPIDRILLKDITLRIYASALRDQELDGVVDAETVSTVASSLFNVIYAYLRKIAGCVDPTEADAVLSYDANVVRLYMASVKSGTKLSHSEICSMAEAMVYSDPETDDRMRIHNRNDQLLRIDLDCDLPF